MRWRDKIRTCPLWIGLILHFFTPTIYCLGLSKVDGKAGPDLASVSPPEWSSSTLWIAVLSVTVLVTAVVAIGCCSCAACQSRGQVQPQNYMMHTHQIRQAVHEARRTTSTGGMLDMNQFLIRLYNMGVRATTITQTLNSPQEMQRLGIFETDISTIGGRQRIIPHFVELEKRLAGGQLTSTPSMMFTSSQGSTPMSSTPGCSPMPQRMSPQQAMMLQQGMMPSQQCMMPQQGMMPPQQGRLSQPGLMPEQGRVSQPGIMPYPQGGPQMYIPAMNMQPSPSNQSIVSMANRPLPQLPPGPRPLPKAPMQKGIILPTTGAKGRADALDAKAEFDEYTIYDQGQLNEYGLLKDAAKRKLEGGAGLDTNADFDEYTIYDQGQLNEYGLHKEAARKKMEGGAGLDANADFDEYTIYDQGQLNEYGLHKEAARKKMEGGAGLDANADFDEYTIYDQGPMNEYGVLKAERERKTEGGAMTTQGGEGRPGTGTGAATGSRPLPAIPGAARPLPAVPGAPVQRPGSIPPPKPKDDIAGHVGDFDEYTIYDQGQLNEYGILKEEARRKIEGGAGLDANADFDEYTIYDQGQLNEYGILKDAAKKKLEGGAGLDANADFDEYTIYDQGPMNEYGILKDAARRKMEGGAGLDTTADFDEYTIYDQGIPGVIPNIPQKKDEKRVRLGASGRPKIRNRMATKKRVRNPKKGEQVGADFDEYTIYDQGPVPGGPKAGAAGLDKTGDFDEYTIYDQGGLNEYAVLRDQARKKMEGAAGHDGKADFDEYTIYDQGELNEYGILKAEKEKKLEGGAGKDVTGADFDEYTIYNEIKD